MFSEPNVPRVPGDWDLAFQAGGVGKAAIHSVYPCDVPYWAGSICHDYIVRYPTLALTPIGRNPEIALHAADQGIYSIVGPGENLARGPVGPTDYLVCSCRLSLPCRPL
jgi:hypothetical protein